MSYRRPYATYSPYSAEVEAEAAKHGMADRFVEVGEGVDVDVNADANNDGEGQMATDKFYSSYKSVFPSLTSSVFRHSIFPYYTYP
jgi:hypothetical protein